MAKLINNKQLENNTKLIYEILRENSINCDSCGQEMKVEKTFKKLTNKTGNKYRVRRFHCDLCDISHTVYADGSLDDERMLEAIEESNNLFKN